MNRYYYDNRGGILDEINRAEKNAMIARRLKEVKSAVKCNCPLYVHPLRKMNKSYSKHSK